MIGRKVDAFTVVVLTSIALFIAPSLAFSAQQADRASNSARPREALFSNDAPLTVTLEVAAYWNGREKDSIQELSNLHPFVLTSWTKDLEKHIGIAPENIVRTTVGLLPDGSWGCALQTVRPLDGDAMLKALKFEATEQKPEQKTPGGAAYFSNDFVALNLVEPRSCLFAFPASAADNVFDKDPRGTLAQDAAPGEGRTNRPLLSVRVNKTPASRAMIQQALAGAALLPLADAETWRIAIVPSTELMFYIRCDFGGPTSAANAVAPLTGLIKRLDEYLGMCEVQMPAAIDRFETEQPGAQKLKPPLMAALAAARVGLKAAKIEQQGNAVIATVAIKTERPVADTILLLSLTPRPGQK